MIAFLPIARYRVVYQVASGRPFSSFERLLLKAIKDGHGSVPALAKMFCIHRRMIVEGLVTLMQAGGCRWEQRKRSLPSAPAG
jgi:hypothetical protein